MHPVETFDEFKSDLDEVFKVRDMSSFIEKSHYSEIHDIKLRYGKCSLEKSLSSLFILQSSVNLYLWHGCMGGKFQLSSTIKL